VFSPIERRQQKLTNKIYTRPAPWRAITKPTIAAIRGYCVGGGLEFALACDLAWRRRMPSWADRSAARHHFPAPAYTALDARGGCDKAMEMCLTGDTVSGVEAKSLGLVNNAVPSADVLKVAEDLADRVLKGAPSRSCFQKAIKKGIELPLEEGLRLESRSVVIDRSTEDAQRRPPRVRRKTRRRCGRANRQTGIRQ